MKDGNIIDLREAFEEHQEVVKEWNKSLRLGDVEYDKKNNCISIYHMHPWQGECTYDIELSRIKTPNSAFHWICHLHEKHWFTPQILHDFVEVLKRITTINEYCSPSFWSEELAEHKHE